jgi:nucleoside phosphorylase
MQKGNHLIFTADPLPSTSSEVSLEVISKEAMLGNRESQKKLREGFITFDPERFHLVFLPPVEAHAALLFPDRTQWDLYLLVMPFTVKELAGEKYYHEVGFHVDISASKASAFDLFPYTTAKDDEIDKSYHFPPDIEITFPDIRPVIVYGGKSEGHFYWTYRAPDTNTPLLPGTKHGLAILQVPRGTSRIEGSIYYRAIIVKRYYRLLQKTAAKTETVAFSKSLPPPPAHVPEPILEEKKQSSLIANAVILTAIPPEYAAVRAHLKELSEIVYKGTIYERGLFQTNTHVWNVGLAEIGAGNVSAAVAAQRALDYFQPDVILFVGVAGGLKDVRIGDVVCATKVYGYESGKADTTFKTRPEVHNSSYTLVERSRAEARKDDWRQRITVEQEDAFQPPKVYIGPIAAGEKVLSSTRASTWKFLRTHYNDALAVEMEGYGILSAVYANRVDALIIRGISDLVDKKEEADAQDTQMLAASHASAFAFELLTKLEYS